MILDEIIAHKKLEVNAQKQHISLDEIKRELADVETVRGFKEAISAPGKVNLIAEIKKASPSRGIIRSDFDPEAIARIYEENGAAAISVLTDREFFQGDLSFLTRARAVTASTPILRKDFIIDEYQIHQARLAGADAILLIAAALDSSTMKRFLSIAHGMDLDCLVEVHSQDELTMVLGTDAAIIGINNRDLRTFKTDVQTTAALMPAIPEDKIVVSESGISSKADVEFLQECGVNAMLVGESLMRSDDIGLRMRQLMST
ncbi:indole-3-glycerol phosphate synthase TrpC [Candidatus Poribacteria bacterium]